MSKDAQMRSHNLTSLRSRFILNFVGLAFFGFACGCYAPLRSPGIPACSLPDSYRAPYRSVGTPLNFSKLTLTQPADYTLGANDLLEVSVPDLYQGAEIRPMQLQVMASGEIQLPLVGPVKVAGMNLQEAQRTITERYGADVLQDPSVNVTLAQPSTIDVLVLGEVNNPGVQSLPRFQNDVGHALAAAGGISEDAAPMIEIHRKSRNSVGLAGEDLDGPLRSELPPIYVEGTNMEAFEQGLIEQLSDGPDVLRIPLRGLNPDALSEADITLSPGDVVRIPSRRNEVFWVVGQLNQTNLVRFTLGDRERELGVGLVIPPDRDIDVVTAVVMAGYLDPIDSPTTVTVQRTRPDGSPMLIHVDLIKARSDRRETILVEPGDIIYVNPDAAWWMRRTFDRIVPDLILAPYREGMMRWINPGRNN